MYLCRGPSYGDKFQGGGERIDSYPPISLTQIWIQESSDNPREPEVIPTTTQYIKETGKQALKLLQTAAPFIPVPFIKEAVDVALKIIEVCEVCKISLRYGNKWLTIYYFQNTSVVNEKVKELKNRVYHLSKVIAETFTPNDENGSEVVIVKAAKGIEQDIKDLLR